MVVTGHNSCAELKVILHMVLPLHTTLPLELLMTRVHCHHLHCLLWAHGVETTCPGNTTSEQEQGGGECVMLPWGLERPLNFHQHFPNVRW